MAVINILIENSYDFIDNNTGFYVSENNYIDIILQDSQEYFVSWKSPLAENDFTYTCIAKEYENSIYLGNFTLLNLPLESDFDSLPFLLQITNGYLTIYTTDFSSNIYSIAIDQFIDTSENIVIRDPLGNEVVYGEYDIVTLAVDNASKKEINYYKLPSLEDDEKNKILMSQEGLWSKTEFPQPNWAENDPTAPSFIKNKPEKFISEQANWNEENPEAQSYIVNKPSLKDFQADWNITDPTKYGYIHNKPTSLGGATKEDQADWNTVDTESVHYIRNRPFGEMPALIEKKEYRLTPSGVDTYYCITIPFPYKVDLEEGQMFEVSPMNHGPYQTPLRKYNGTDINGTQMEIYGLGNISDLIINGDFFKPDKNYPWEFSDCFIQFFENYCKIFRGPMSSSSFTDIPLQLEVKYLNGRKLGSQHLNGELLPYSEKCANGSIMMIKDGKWETTTTIPIDKAQPDWEIRDASHPQFIKNKPFGFTEPIVRNNSYNFVLSKLDNIFITEEIPFYYESIPDQQCYIRWNGEVYYASYRSYYAKLENSNDDENICGIGNSRLIVPQGTTIGPFRDAWISETNIDFPFFIDFTNKRICSSTEGSFTVEVGLYGPKKIDKRFLSGELLPDPTNLSNNLIVMVKNGKWITSEQLQVNWDNTNPLSYEFIKNKPFGELPLLLQGAADITEQSGSYKGYYGGFFVHTLDSNRLMTGKKYNISFNNTIYSCTCFTNDLGITVSSHYFGNASFIDNSKNNTKEPFFISIGGYGSEDNNYLYVGLCLVNDKTLDNTTINVEINDNSYKKIESKYLPLDTTLTKPNHAAEATAVGNLVAEFQSIIEEQNTIIAQLRSQVYNLSVRLDALDGGGSTPGASVVGETLIVEGSENNEGLILTYGYVDGETLTFDTSSGSAAVTEDELNVSGSVDTTDDTLNTSGVVTTDGVWEV